MLPIYLRNNPDDFDLIEVYKPYYLLNHLASWIEPFRYLELGVRDGVTLSHVQKHAKQCYGVDINFLNKDFDDNVTLFEMCTDDFFNQLDNHLVFDLVFIDADHSKEQVYKDFMNVKDRVIEDGFVLFHDTYPFSEKSIDPLFSGDCYLTIKRIKQEFHQEWEILTLPFTPGITIMKKMPLTKQVLWI
jgi:predicted O-methyltransferase YrrM